MSNPSAHLVLGCLLGVSIISSSTAYCPIGEAELKFRVVSITASRGQSWYQSKPDLYPDVEGKRLGKDGNEGFCACGRSDHRYKTPSSNGVATFNWDYDLGCRSPDELSVAIKLMDYDCCNSDDIDGQGTVQLSSLGCCTGSTNTAINSNVNGHSFTLTYKAFWTFPPTPKPSAAPSESPTPKPSAAPSESPTTLPSPQPTQRPTPRPTASPISSRPTRSPVSSTPTDSPTLSPTASPTVSPTVSPTALPTTPPTAMPTSAAPTVTPSQSPSLSPTSQSPTQSPVTSGPSISPTMSPSSSPTQSPSTRGSLTSPPTASPSTSIIVSNELAGVAGGVGTITGIAIASVLFCVLAVAMFFIWRKRTHESKETFSRHGHDNPVYEGSTMVIDGDTIYNIPIDKNIEGERLHDSIENPAYMPASTAPISIYESLSSQNSRAPSLADKSYNTLDGNARFDDDGDYAHAIQVTQNNALYSIPSTADV